MMKKITRIAALLAATAFLLAGIPACSGDDDGDDTPTLSTVEIAIADTVKTDYKVGDELNWEGITVTATYSDGSTKNVTEEATITATYEDAPFTTETAGSYDVILTASYEGKPSPPKTLPITVKGDNDEQDEKPTLESLAVTIADTVKTEYTVGEEFDKTGITVTATYSNGTEKDETANATIAVTYNDAPFTTEKAGSFDVTITATYEGKPSDPKTLPITVKEDDGEQGEKPTLTKIAVTIAETAKSEYKVGDAFDKTGITVTATYSNDTTKDVTANATITATYNDAPFTTETAGTFDVTITAAYGGQTATATCKITVNKDESGKPVETPTLTNIAIAVAESAKTEYKVGEEFDKTGITVTATYSNGTTKDITSTATITAKSGDKEISALEAGPHEVTITATYEGQTDTATRTITVKDDSSKPVEPATLTGITIAVADTLKTEYTAGEEFDKTGITVTATYSDDSTKDVTDKATIAATSGDAPFTTAAAGSFDVTFTATYEGQTATTTRTITVKAKGTPYAWNFQAAELNTVLSFATAEDGKAYLDAEGTYEATPAGLTLVLPKNLKFNKIETTVTASGASKGAIQPLAGDNGDIYVEVQGPFTAEMLYASNGGTKTDGRYAYIKIGTTEAAKSTGDMTDTVSGLSYTYNGTDTVKVSFGGTNYIRIYDIKITTENGDGTGKNAGEVKSKAEFVATTDDTTANDTDTLGLVGTNATSSDTEVATAEITDGKVVITSVSAGTATITVTNDEGNAATIEVTVSGMGKVTIGKITPYVDLASIFTVTDGVLELKADSYAYYLSAGNLDDTTGNNAWSARSDKKDGTSKKSDSPFSEGITALDMKSNRYITLKVKGVAAFDVYVQKNSADRKYTVSINDTNAQEGSSSNAFTTFTTGTTDEVTIKITNSSSNSVYPVGVILYKEVPAASN